MHKNTPIRVFLKIHPQKVVFKGYVDMKETFLVLLTAHLAGDFLFQKDGMVKAKRTSSGWLLLHSAMVTSLTLLLAAYVEENRAVWVYAGVFLAHFVIDWIKKLVRRDGFYAFVFDQAAHIATLWTIAFILPGLASQSLWLKLLPAYYFKAMVFISGFISCVFVGGILISKATKPLVKQIKEITGLENGGRYIGQLERALIFFFMLTGQTNAIGFLFAAKSILRFSEIKEPEKRKEAEYIIIGTFMSFGWALLTAYLTGKALTLW
jgi:hypothetical protein